jgi:hypothetical protein
MATIQRETGCGVSVKPDAETWTYPEIDVTRVRRDFGFQPSMLLQDLPALINDFRRKGTP